MKRFFTLLVLVALVFQMVACGEDFFDGSPESTPTTESSQTTDTTQSKEPVQERVEPIDNPIDKMIENVPVPLPVPMLLNSGFSDNTNNYFYIKLGTVENVLTSSYAQFMYDGRQTLEYKWERTETTETTYEKVNAKTIENSTKTETVTNLDTKISADAKASYGGLSASVSGEISAGIQNSLSTGSTSSISEQFTKAMTNKIEDVTTMQYSFTPDLDSGYYRYSFYSDFDVYAALVCNRTTKTISYIYVTVPVAGNDKEGFRYSASGKYEQSSAPDLALTADMLNSLNIDYFSDDLQKGESYVYAETHYINTTKKTIKDNGSYGLEQTQKGDVLDLSAIPAQYFTSEYLVTFTVTVNYECDKNIWGWVDGTHEMHLYNKYNSNQSDTTDTLNDSIVKKSFGWILREDWTGHKGDDTFVWEVDGSDCASTMYLLYDAHGDEEDTWFRHSIYIVITVTKK